MSTTPDPFDQIAQQLRQAHTANPDPEATPVTHSRGRSRRIWAVSLLAGLTIAGTATAAVVVTSKPSEPAAGQIGSATGSPRDYTVTLTPLLQAGSTGWCAAAQIATDADAVGASSCGQAPTKAYPVIASGGLMGTATPGGESLLYAVVDERVAAMKIGTGEKITPVRDPSLPPGFRAIVATPTKGEDFVTSAFENENGIEIPAATAASSVGRQGVRSVPTRDASRAPCSLTAESPVAMDDQEVLRDRPAPAPNANGRPFLACASSIVRISGRPYFVAILVDAKKPGQRPANLPGAVGAPERIQDLRGGLSARRDGAAWLVVRGTDRGARRRVLAAVNSRIDLSSR